MRTVRSAWFSAKNRDTTAIPRFGIEQTLVAKSKQKAKGRQELIAAHSVALRSQAEFFVFSVCRPRTHTKT